MLPGETLTHNEVIRTTDNIKNKYEEMLNHETEDDYDADDEIPDKNEGYNNDEGEILDKNEGYNNDESLNKAKSGQKSLNVGIQQKKHATAPLKRGMVAGKSAERYKS